MNSTPILIEVRRGGLMESLHHGHAVACDAKGAVIAAWGDRDRPTFPRSAIKPIQALPLVETGAAAAFGLGAEEIALACSSHAAEPMHVDRIRAWLERIGLSADDLECGAHAPANPEAAAALVRAGNRPCPLHNNCSGKHSGFLTVARHLGIPTAGYIHHDHPVQQLVSAAIADLTGEAGAPWGVDGCGIPTYRLRLSAIAAAMARLADPSALPPGRREAAETVVAAMRTHPLLVAGSGRLCSRVMATVAGIALKGGAEGVYTAIVPERGLGVAAKVEDGTGRAAEVAVLAVLDRLGVLTDADKAALADRMAPPVLNVAGKVVGEIRVG